jgi:hypothetical protein
MSIYKRSGKKWSINELLALEREYELLELDVQKIALTHERSVEAILSKLESEGIISSWNDARGYLKIENDNTVIMNNNVSEVDKLSDRIWSLETNVEEINGLVKQMLECMSLNKNTRALTSKKSRLIQI